ncbi:MAG: 2-C-methyl-D-erythritol 2,4-cyclodiphosphate synthase [Bryobacterales bacterium]|nr:2-C-methyl-D-erythritol 2,4-cyclodiphosphate synthase [Bryobacteraceae bacterium]MDW8130142.1 2-C-methyl-D-erythritol 2,4-cyclodiphosphate synthase [Bryobacterales bacterium]
MQQREYRSGIGWDIHPLVPGRPLILGGVRIPFELGLGGHSDADALAHAITDALLGAAGLGDIGEHFPDTDPRWKDADSVQLLRQAAGMAAARGFAVAHVDATVILERPKLGPYREAMRGRLAEALELPLERLSLKFKTAEGMGPVGKGSAVEALAVVTLVRNG